MDARLDIHRIAFIGRTFDEYMRIFALDESLLRKGPVLDCPAGAASFAAEANRAGVDVVACDILYDLKLQELIRKGEEDIRLIYDKVGKVSHLYVWDYYKNRDELIAHRKKSLTLFADDFADGLSHDRYRKAALPHLPFNDNAFSLVISSHFLFLYGSMLDPEFHKASLMELMRVSSGEVRLFPLHGLDAKPYPYLGEVISFLHTVEIDAEITEMPFEFQRGGNKMITLRRKSGSYSH